MKAKQQTLDPKIGEAIVTAVEEVATGKWDGEFNMNRNEVLSVCRLRKYY